MSIQSEITRLTNKRNASFTAVASKGVTVPSGSTMDDLPDLIGLISVPSGSKSVTINQNGTRTENVAAYETIEITTSVSGSSSAIVVTDTTDEYGGTIRTITAVDISSDTVAADKLLQGYTAHNSSGEAITGSYVPAGTSLQAKTATPTESQQTITPDSGYDGLSSVTVGAISSTYVGSGIDQNDSTDLTASGATVTAPAGYYATAASKSIASGSATTPATSITANPTISVSATGLITATVSGSKSVTPTVSAGYVSSGTAGTVSVSGSNTEQLTVKSSTDLTASGATVTAPAGYYPSAATKTIGSGSSTAPASISGTSATVSAGTNTLTLTKTVSVTPTVSAGYISSGTAGNSSVSLTASVTTKAAAMITPGTTDQTIASGTYLTGTQTIAGDADLVASNIISTANIFGVQGSVVIQHYYTGSSAPSASTGANGDIYLQTGA